MVFMVYLFEVECIHRFISMIIKSNVIVDRIEDFVMLKDIVRC
jgi:hypothetical protein